ncbi:hypothetical protein [Xylophilus sp. GOD-11R]|uniref:hypothetical protein n=1 Tax=Xylophilus sp. GOD-11R TaxID=3089814 RepID=UPI00298C16E6|nr:hypothetical protein [Xylophilus sp. GOD-11R]WPB55841.1 hypothetical protein R9X41_17050 [Xylophilus sp. GOD-11R]
MAFDDSTAVRFQRAAVQWRDADRAPSLLASGRRLIALRAWLASAGARSAIIGESLREYRLASEAAQEAGWLDAWFSEPEYCVRCGERYRFENIALCTACSRCFCHSCAGRQAKAANGNPSCDCGVGELVG